MNQLLRQPHPPGCPSGLMLDRLTAGELQGEELQATDQHVQGCLTCAARLGQNEAFRAGFAASLPPLRRPLATPALPRSNPRTRWSLGRVLGGAGALAAAAVAVVLAPGLMRSHQDAGTRAKGPPPAGGENQLGFFVQRGAQVVRGRPGEALGPGSRVQFVYSAAARVWLAVISLDGAGKVSVYFPDGEAVTAPVPAGRERPLPVSTVLDATPGTEQVFGLFCDAPVALAPLRSTLAQGRGEPQPPAGCRLSRLTWEKRP